MNLFDLTGKRALLTGAASGLGLAMVEGLHEAGAAVGILDIAENTPLVAAETGSRGAAAGDGSGAHWALRHARRPHKGTVVFLALAASDYVRATTIPVDGGFLGR